MVKREIRAIVLSFVFLIPAQYALASTSDSPLPDWLIQGQLDALQVVSKFCLGKAFTDDIRIEALPVNSTRRAERVRQQNPVIIRLHPNNEQRNRNSLRRTLYHEATHAVLHKNSLDELNCMRVLEQTQKITANKKKFESIIKNSNHRLELLAQQSKKNKRTLEDELWSKYKTKKNNETLFDLGRCIKMREEFEAELVALVLLFQNLNIWYLHKKTDSIYPTKLEQYVYCKEFINDRKKVSKSLLCNYSSRYLQEKFDGTFAQTLAQVTAMYGDKLSTKQKGDVLLALRRKNKK